MSAHWGCLAKTQQDEILKAALERDRAEWQANQAQAGTEDAAADQDPPKDSPPEPKRRTGLDSSQMTEFVCGSCTKGAICMICKELAVKADDALQIKPSIDDSHTQALLSQGDVQMMDGAAETLADSIPDELVFRCMTCKRVAHYAHLPAPPDLDIPPDEVTPATLADYYQNTNKWQCHDCASYIYAVEHILAWRPYPEDAVEPSRPPGEPVNHKAMLPREYLVKWADRSYRRTSWVPHGWLLATHASRLKNFLAHGSRVPLLLEAAEQDEAQIKQVDSTTFEIDQEDADDTTLRAEANALASLLPEPDAERKIPPAWKTVDRVLDVLLWNPQKRTKPQAKSRGKRRAGKTARRVESDDNEDSGLDLPEEFKAVYDTGEQPSDHLTETVAEYEFRTDSLLQEEDVGKVVWALIKWDDLGYEDGECRFHVRAFSC